MGNGIDSSVRGYSSFNPNLLSDDLPTWLMIGSKWGSAAVGNGISLTYSFSTASSFYKFNYGNDQDSGVKDLTTAQKTAAASALAEFAAIANLTFGKVTESSTLAGDIRFANTEASTVPTAEAYYPSSSAEGGDVWFGSQEDYKTPTPGTYAYYTFLHELGHALGLRHTHEGGAPSGRDAIKYSVMAYRDYVGDTLDSINSKYTPTTLMIDDIRALQAIYGANTGFNAGNTVYKWNNNQKIYETIWDGGGADTIDASNQIQGVIIKLAEGSYSSIGGRFFNGKADVRDCLGIAYGCKIENAKGSTKVDTLVGNKYTNALHGLDGDDLLNGAGGNDKLTGGGGADKYLFCTVLNSGTNVDTINDFSLSGGDVIQLDNLIFQKLKVASTLNAANFRSNAWGGASDSNDYILYENDTGKLFYDVDGNGAGAKVQFALIGTTTHAALTAADFAVI